MGTEFSISVIIGVGIAMIAVIGGIKYFVLPSSFQEISQQREDVLKEMVKHEQDILPPDADKDIEKDTEAS